MVYCKVNINVLRGRVMVDAGAGAMRLGMGMVKDAMHHACPYINLSMQYLQPQLQYSLRIRTFVHDMPIHPAD